ncbi:MAG: FprA family A-type flavoprotein [Treponema sp.]|nr:FprA family A-type flavoprotein [Treponema sp.]
MYNVREVTKDVWWVGGHDHRLTLFENLHPIPKGVSYNAYVLFDEKNTILFDTVEWTSSPQLMENIEFLLKKYGRTKLDYLVVNHMECDHSASVTEILLRFPDITIISTEKGFMLMRQFAYNPDDYKTHQVKEGDTFSFGKHTVAFVEAPMVHWPEVMITLDVTNGVLFSADAFGSFMALDGKLFADEVNYDRDWIDEARRYLCNIVGKYGPEVQHLIGKAAPLLPQVKYICSLHGLVWRKPEDINYIVDKYVHWSTYTPEQKGVLLVYGSMYGNTESAAFALASKIVEKGMTNINVYDASSTHVSYLIAEAFKFSHIVIACPTYNLNIYPPIRDFLEHMKLLNMQKRSVAIVENGSWAVKSGDLIQKFIEDGMKDIDILNERITIASSMGADKAVELDRMAQEIVDSVNAAQI